MADEITPAIQLDNGKPLSPEEFQKMLYDYFEDRGILSDLRAHLRSQMIKALKETSMGTDFMNKNRDISPKLQALNLLIAEYLLQRDYHYSLSVFSTEVPLNNVFPAINDKSHPTSVIKFKFSENDMWDILETLGFLQSSLNGKTISNIYLTNSKESLLNCILKTTNVQIESWQEPEHNSSKITENDGSLENFIVFLKEARLQPDITIKIIDQLKAIITTEMSRVHECKVEEIMNIKRKMELEANKKLEKYRRKVRVMEAAFTKERKRLEVELDAAKHNLRECAQSLQTKSKDIHGMEESLKSREKQLITQAELLNEKEKILQKQLEDVVTDRMNFRETQNRVERRSVKDADFKARRETQERSQQTYENINIENVLLKHNTKHLQQQIDRLKEQNASYLTRLQELAMRTTTLMQQLESSRMQVQELNSSHSQRTSTVAPVSVPSVATIGCRNTYGIASYSGGGEEGNKIAPLTGRHFKNVVFNKDIKRKKQYILQNSSSSEELSPTDTILKEAKMRLLSLEKESDDIDKHYDKCSSITTPNVLQDFQQNLECIRKSISRIFSRDSCYSEPGTSALISRSTMSLKTADALEIEKDDVLKIKKLIADLPENFRGQDYENVIQTLGVQENVMSGPSANSSGVQLGTSFSTVELSTDCKTDVESPRLRANTNGEFS